MTQPSRPLLEDPLHEKELFASEIVGVGMIHGNIAITLANVRFDESVGNQPPRMRRVVAGRIILTGAAASALLQNLQQLGAQLKPPTGEQKPN